MIDDQLSFKQHISFVCFRISRNTGIFFKLRRFLPLQQLKQLYYYLIYPYISYAIVAWGSSCKSHLQKLQTKHNHLFRAIFFATLYGKYTEPALPFLNLLDILTVSLLRINHPTLYNRRMHNILIIVFKALHGLVPEFISKLFT